MVAVAGGDLGFCFYLGLGYVGTQEFFGFGFGFFGLIALPYFWLEFFCLTLERCLSSFYLIRDELNQTNGTLTPLVHPL